jgi:mono/diheme cytochrome c family protein
LSGRLPALLIAVSLCAACRQDMHDQPRYKPYAPSDFFGDRRSARAPVAGTVARGQLREDDHLHTGKLGAAFADSLPFPLTAQVLARGRERFTIYCAPCHGQVGRGDGMVVRRGFRRAATFHTDRLRGEPVGYFFDVMTRGFGAMSDYATQIPPADRWAIAAYVKALQLSQHADVSELPPGRLEALGLAAGQAPAARQEPR